MSLKTGILTLIGENGKETELKTVGKIFRIGSYLSCDLVLDNPEARNVHCEIQSDSFGRITITNHSKSNPVRINGVPLKGTRPLYTGSFISIFEQSLKWVNKHRLPRNIVDMDKNQTPKIGFKRTDQAPNSEPSAPMRRKHAQKRLTMHNFGTSKHLVDEDDVDTLRDGNDENKRQDRLTRASIISAAKSFGATPPRSACRSKILSRRTVDAKIFDGVDACKENKMNDTPEMKKLTLLKCQSSAMVVTSYSPNATPKKTPSSFACVMSNKNTPKSAYGTPRSVLSELNTSECIKSECSTPKTPTDLCTMYLIDLTSPDVYKTPLQKRTPLFRSALKNSAAKSVSKVPSKYDPNSTIKSCSPSSNKKLRWNTSDAVIKAEKAQTPVQTIPNKSTPYRKSSITPNKLRQSLASRSTGKKLHDCLSKSITETPPSLTRQRTLTAGSAKSTHSISKVTPLLKRKSLNISLPLKTPKEIFSDGKSTTPKNARLSSLRIPNSSKFVPIKDTSAKKPQARTSVSVLDRSKTFIVDSPSISQMNSNKNNPNKTEEHVEDVNAASDTFSCGEDFEMKAEEHESRKTPRKSKLSVSNMEIETKEDLKMSILHEEQNITNPILSDRDVSLLSNKSKHNLTASSVSKDNFIQETPIEDEFHATAGQEDISFEHENVLNNPTNLSVSNSTFNKSNRSLNNTFDKTESETTRRKSLRGRSVKENKPEESKTNISNTLDVSTKLDSPQDSKLEETNRKSMRLSRTSRNIELVPCQDQIQYTGETTTTPVVTPCPMNGNIVSNKEYLEKQLELSLKDGQSPENDLDFQEETPVQDESETISDQDNIFDEQEVFSNPSNMSVSNSTFNKSNRQLNDTFDETEVETSRRKSLRRRTLNENDPEESNVRSKLNFSSTLNSTQEDKFGTKARKSTKFSQSNTNIESVLCADQIQFTGENTTTPVASPRPMNGNVSNKECLEKSLEISLRELQAPENDVGLQEGTPVEDESGTISDQDCISVEHEVFNKSSNMSVSNSSFNKSNWSLNNTFDETEDEASRRKSLRRRTLKGNEPEESNVSSKLNFSTKLDSTQEEKSEIKGRKSTRLSQTNTNIESISRQYQIQSTTATTPAASPRLINENIMSNKECVDKQLEESLSDCLAAENDVDLQEETPVEDESGTISDQDNISLEHKVFNNASNMSVSNNTFNKSNRSLNKTFDGAELETSRGKSLRRQSLKERSVKDESGTISKEENASFEYKEGFNNPSNESVSYSAFNKSNRSLNNTCEEKIEISRRKSIRRRTLKENEPEESHDNNKLNFSAKLYSTQKEISGAKSRKSMRLSQTNTSIESISSQGQILIFNGSKCSENDLNFLQETPFKGRPESITEKGQKSSEVDEVFNKSSKSSIPISTLNKSNRSLKDTADNTERSGQHENSQRKSLRRRSEKEIEPEADNVHAAEELNSTDLDEQRRKSLRVSRTNKNIESISSQDQTDKKKSGILVQSETVATPLASSDSVSENDDNNKQSASPKLFGSKAMKKTPKISKDIDFTGVKELMRGRKSTVGLKNVVGVKELFNTPKQGGLTNLVGVRELIKTPKAGEGLIDAKGMKEMFNTPTRDDLTDVFGVKELMNTPKSSTGLDDPKGMKELFNTPTRDDLSDVYGVKELVNTPKPSVGLTDLKGMKELFNTPTRDDLTDVFGVKELVNTPQTEQGFEDARGVKELFNTPARDDLTDVFGVKELVNTPKPEIGFEDGKGVKELFKTPKDYPGFVDTRGVKELFNTPITEPGLDDGKGVRELFKTPKSTPSIRDARGVKELFNTPALNNISDVRGVKELMKTPIDNSPNLTGMHELMKTPYIPCYEETDGISDVFKTPASRGVMVLSTPKSIAVEKLSTSSGNLLKTPKELNVLEDIEEVEEIFKTPVSNLMNSEFENDDSINASPEESFDKLVGKSSIRRTYGRKSVTPRILPIPVATEIAEDHAKTDIQEWVDNVVTSPNFEAESQKKEEIIINSPVVKLHRKPLATSSSIKPTKRRKSSRFTNALLKDGDLNEVSGIEQLEDSFLSSSEISGVFVENDETSKEIIVDTVTDSPEIRKRITNTKKSSITSKTPQKSVQFVDSSHHAIKVTPQIRRLRNRVSTPYTKKAMQPDSTNDPFADLSIQYIDESSLNISTSKDKSNNTSLYKIQKSGRTDDVSLELIDSEESSIKRSAILSTVNNSTMGVEVESISIQENSKKSLSALKKGRKSRKTITESGCVISISDDEIVNSTSRSKDGRSLLKSASKKSESGPVEFVATNELSVSGNNLIHCVDAFQSISNDSENITLIDVGASIDDTKELSAYTVSENLSGENSASLVDSVSYEEEEEKLLSLYDTRFSNTTKGQTLEIVYVDSNSRTEDTNVSIDAGGINLDDEPSSISNKSMERNATQKSLNPSAVELSERNNSIDAGGINLDDDPSSISTKSTRKSLSKSVMSVKEESCLEKTMEGKATQKSLNLSTVDISERNNSLAADSINLDDEPSSISKNSSRKSLRKSVMSKKEYSFVENTIEENATPKSLNLSAVELSEKNNSMRKSNAFNQTNSSLANQSIEQESQDNSKDMANEFANFDANLEVEERFVGNSLTPKANKSGQAEKNKRKTMGGISSSKPIDLEAEKMRLEFSNFSTNPTVMMTRASSQLELKSPRLTVSRRTTGQLPLNPYFNVEAEKDRRNLSIEFENFNSNNVRRSWRGQSLSPVKNKKDVKERRTVGQKPLTNESFDYETELERRNMSLEFSQFEEVPSKRSNLRGRSLASTIEKTDEKSKNRLTMGQLSKNKFNYEAEVDRRNMSLDFENFNPVAQVEVNSRRMTVVVEKALVSKPNSRLSEGQNVAETNFDLQAEQARRKLSLEFKSFDENPSRKPRSRGQSEKFESMGASSSSSNSRKTLGGRPSSDDFNMERELEKYNIGRELQNLNAENNLASGPGSYSESPVKISELNSILFDNEVPATDKIVVAEPIAFKSQDVICNSEELPEETNECLSENKCVPDSTTKDASNTSENKHVEFETEAKARHVRFGENVYYEISLLDSSDSNENQNKNSRGRKKPKAAAAEGTIEKQKSAPRSRSRKNKAKEDNGSSEGMSEHGVEASPVGADQFKLDDKTKENVTTRRGKRNRTIVEQTEEKLNEVSSLKAAEPSDHNHEQLGATEVNRRPTRAAEESSVSEEVAASFKPLSNEPSINHQHEDTDFEEKVNVGTRRPRRGAKPKATVRQEYQSESLDHTSKVEEIVSKSAVQEQDVEASESDVKDENAEKTKTRSRRGKQTTSDKYVKQKEDKMNIEDEHTVSNGLSDNTDANLAEKHKQEILRVETSQEKVDAEVPKSRNRRVKTSKKVESETSVPAATHPNEGTLPSAVIVNAAEKAIDSTSTTTVLNEIPQTSSFPEAENISKIHNNPTERQVTEKNGKESMNEVRNDNNSSAKISRARKVAQINDVVRSSPRTKVRFNAEKTSKTGEVGEIKKGDKTADGEEIENSNRVPPSKRSQRLVSVDVENEKITDRITTDTSGSLLGVDANKPITTNENESRGRNRRRKPLLETDTLNTESPADILPAKRTRRLASNVELTASDSKTKGRSARAKGNKEEKENLEIMPEKVSNDAEVFKIPNELKPKVDTTPLRPESPDEDASVGHVSHPEPVKTKRARRLVSVDEQSTNDQKDTETPILSYSTNIVPAKRTRRLASSSEATVSNVKPKGRAGHVKAKLVDREDVDNVFEPPNAAEVLQSTNEEIHKNTDTQLIRESNTLTTNASEGKDVAVTKVPESEPVVTRRNRRLASVDDEWRPASRSARTRGKKEEKEEKEDSQSNESKDHDCLDPKTERDDIVFKTPNEVKPKRRGARLRSTTDTPTKDSAETVSHVPARRTRRLASVEPVPKITPEITDNTSSDEQATSTKRIEPENMLGVPEQNNEKSDAESKEKESLSKVKPKRGRKAAVKSQPSTLEIEQDKNVQSEEKTFRQPNEHPKDSETPEVSTSKTTKRGRAAKRKVESAEVNTDEVVTKTRVAAKSQSSKPQIEQNKDDDPEEKTSGQPSEQPNNPEITPEESTSKTTKRGRVAKRKVESAEVNTDEVVTKTRVAAKSQSSKPQIEQNKDDDPEEKTSGQPNEQPNNPETIPEESSSKTTKRGRAAKRKVEIVEVNTDEVVMRTRSRRK